MTSLLQRATPRSLFALVVLLVVAAMGSGLYLQYVVGLEPCPLCVLQRVGFILTGFVALAGALLARRRGAQIATALLASMPALAGGGVAVWHTWLTLFPPESHTCGRPFRWFDDDFPLVLWLPRLFRGAGDCLHRDWTLLGLSIPQWSVLIFAALIALLGAALVRGARRR